MNSLHEDVTAPQEMIQSKQINQEENDMHPKSSHETINYFNYNFVYTAYKKCHQLEDYRKYSTNRILPNEIMTIGELIISVNDNGYFVNSNSKIISDG